MPDQRPSPIHTPQPSWKRVSPELACALAVSLDDECYYLFVRTPGGRRASPANALVADFKMPPGEYRESLRMWRRKQDAVRVLAGAVADLLEGERFCAGAAGDAAGPAAHALSARIRSSIESRRR